MGPPVIASPRRRLRLARPRVAPSLSHNATPDKEAGRARIPQHARRPSRRPGSESRASGKRSKLGTNEYGGHGPVGATAIPAARDAIGAMRARKLAASDRGARKATDPATLLLPPADRQRHRPIPAPVTSRSRG